MKASEREKEKKPKNPASIQSDAAGSGEKPIYQEEEDAQRTVPADEDRDPSANPDTPGSVPGEEDPRASKPASGAQRSGEEDRKARKPGSEKEKDDEHYAPESGDKLG